MLEQAQIIAERRPFDRIFDVALLLDRLLLHPIIERAHRPALTHYFERYALAKVALTKPIDQKGFRRPTEHVDEAGRDGEAIGVDHLAGSRRASRAGCGARPPRGKAREERARHRQSDRP